MFIRAYRSVSDGKWFSKGTKSLPYRIRPQPAGAFDMSALTEVLSTLTLNLASGAEEKKPEENSPFALLDDDDDPDNIF